MACAANYAWVNRSSMTFLCRQAFAKMFGSTPDDLDMHVVYDVSHNIAKVGGLWGVVGCRARVCVCVCLAGTLACQLASSHGDGGTRGGACRARRAAPRLPCLPRPPAAACAAG